MQTRYEENKGFRGLKASIFRVEPIPKWNTFTVSDCEFISKGQIKNTIGEINPKLKIHKKKSLTKLFFSLFFIIIFHIIIRIK
jgi:hypothetical protein